MRIVRTIEELREHLRDRDGRTGLVPTMGALHDGHLSLIRAARAQNETVVVSVFVNPLQFDDATDLAAYPRNELADANSAASAGADLLFAPDARELYPPGFATRVQVRGTITETLEGAARGSEHFDGVATVVLKLLLAALPDTAYFGAKDAQQVVVIRRMVTDLNVPTRIEVVPTSREADGLARSSRNVHLQPEDRRRASALARGLHAASRAAAAGERQSSELRAAALKTLAEEAIVPEYLAVVDPDTLDEVALLDHPSLLVVAARVGSTRLIDNILLTPGGR